MEAANRSLLPQRFTAPKPAIVHNARRSKSLSRVYKDFEQVRTQQLVILQRELSKSGWDGDTQDALMGFLQQTSPQAATKEVLDQVALVNTKLEDLNTKFMSKLEDLNTKIMWLCAVLCLLCLLVASANPLVIDVCCKLIAIVKN
jgi:hypothetical protein